MNLNLKLQFGVLLYSVYVAAMVGVANEIFRYVQFQTFRRILEINSFVSICEFNVVG